MSDAASSKNLINVMRQTLSHFFFHSISLKKKEKKISLSCDKLEYVVINDDTEGKISPDGTYKLFE